MKSVENVRHLLLLHNLREMSSKTESELKFAPSTIYFFVESRSFASVYVPITCVPVPAYLSDTLAQVLQNFVNNARPGNPPPTTATTDCVHSTCHE